MTVQMRCQTVTHRHAMMLSVVTQSRRLTQFYRHMWITSDRFVMWLYWWTLQPPASSASYTLFTIDTVILVTIMSLIIITITITATTSSSSSSVVSAAGSRPSCRRITQDSSGVGQLSFKSPALPPYPRWTIQTPYVAIIQDVETGLNASCDSDVKHLVVATKCRSRRRGGGVAYQLSDTHHWSEGGTKVVRLQR